MLSSLRILNYALINHLEINFSNHLTIITGETGAGKSIMLGALGLLLGERADVEVLYDKEKKCIVEGDFDITKLGLQDFFETNDLEYDGHCIIRREIATSGKSRGFINDTPVTLQVLKSLGEQLMDLHRQHETLHLNTAKFQLLIIDAIAQHEPELHIYKNGYKSYIQKINKLELLLNEQEQLKRNLDYFQYQFNELSAANLIDGELNELESESEILENAENIKSNLVQSFMMLNNSDSAVLIQLKTVMYSLQSIKQLKPELNEIYNRLNSSVIELKDIADELENIEEGINIDAERLQIVNERIDLINKLLKKHSVSNEQELILLRDDVEQKIKNVEIANDESEQLKNEIEQLKLNLLHQAKVLSNKRLAVASPFENEVNKLLAQVGMPHAILKIEHSVNDELNISGIDNFKFLFTANKGSSLQEIGKVASGGELSRLMLCIKSLVAASAHLPTLVFDEIDTGISGEVAMQVGNILHQLANNHQVLCITHLPQIAAKGQSHYFVYKSTENERTISQIKQLNNTERVVEIAKMLSGNQPGEAALANAKELMN
ncbi:MAG: repair protein RecN [Bacteroidota bacterium]|jgi:DNA repair protein RecN (Recombination protein N)